MGDVQRQLGMGRREKTILGNAGKMIAVRGAALHRAY
jgi:hypothetical protein